MSVLQYHRLFKHASVTMLYKKVRFMHRRKNVDTGQPAQSAQADLCRHLLAAGHVSACE